ncbi:hypothetical protein [Spiroplasma monobiae]|uniref:Transmembrane protein n=1 Tax=Spiroplasma monobiae MQ-1 TaxID=1336748 RepID=A0A2K9LUR0_SPISQ|nr:hypothetical protein [Spiroplasma monobiae]AUM62786.1 hypothetical protein SMONO_v1c05370 [Spiroplasma monobiae MQ-1]
MNFRLPAKYALLIINVLVILYFFLYFCLLGFEYKTQDGSLTVIFKGLNFSSDYELSITGSYIVVPFGQMVRFFELLNNEISNGTTNFPNSTYIAGNLDIFIISMLSIQCLLIFLSFINLFIWRGFKKAKTIDILSKILIVTFVSLAISWSVYAQGMYLTKTGNILLYPDGQKAWIYIIGQIIMPILFMFIHIWMTAPLYRKRNK